MTSATRARFNNPMFTVEAMQLPDYQQYVMPMPGQPVSAFVHTNCGKDARWVHGVVHSIHRRPGLSSFTMQGTNTGMLQPVTDASPWCFNSTLWVPPMLCAHIAHLDFAYPDLRVSLDVEAVKTALPIGKELRPTAEDVDALLYWARHTLSLLGFVETPYRGFWSRP